MNHIPSFYKAAHAAKWNYNPAARILAEEAPAYAADNKITKAVNDGKRVALMPIDVQRDFCFPEGTLYVGGRSGTGAIDDSRRLTEFIYREMGSITSIFPTLDTHEAFQIFSPMFWLDENGKPLQPHDMIDGEMTIMRAGKPAGRATPNPVVAGIVGVPYAWLLKQVQFYCKKVVEGGHTGKYMLYIWPEHCILGSEGHNLVGLMQEARLFHSYVRGAQNSPQVKGGNPLTENYSIFGPEVTERYDQKGAIAQRNVSLLKTLLDYDAVIIAGQAASHCVKSSIDDLVKEILVKDKALAQKVYVLRDCTSSVVVPGLVDFTSQAEKALDEYAALGMNIVNSTDPMASWLKA